MIHSPIQAVRLDGRGRYWVFVPGEIPTVFDRSGKFLRVIGRAGSGPGEFISAVDGLSIPGDLMLIIDAGQSRAILMDAEFRAHRHISIPGRLRAGVVHQWPSSVIMSGSVNTPDGAGWPLHRVSFAGSPAEVIRSFGPGTGELRSGAGASRVEHRLSVSQGAGYWSSDINQYRVHRWTNDGARLLTLERTPSWFQPNVAPAIPGRDAPPSPAIAAIAEDGQRTVWVFVRIPAPSWQRARESLRMGGNEVPVRDSPLHLLFETTIEALDPRSQRVIARVTVPRLVVGALPGARVAFYEVGSNGVSRVRIAQVVLQRP